MYQNNCPPNAKEASRTYADERTELLETIHEIVVQEVERQLERFEKIQNESDKNDNKNK